MMIRRTFDTALISGLAFFTASNAFALVSGEVTGGQRSVRVVYDTTTEKNKSQTASGSEVTGSLLVDPFMGVPVAFGITVQSASYDRSKADQAIVDDMIQAEGLTDYLDSSVSTKTSTLLYGPTIKVWAPTPYVKPYLKYSYLMGSGVDKLDVTLKSKVGSTPVTNIGSKGTSKFSQNGSDLGLGLAFTPSKLFGIFLELAIHSGTSKVTDQNIETTSVIDSETTTSTASKDDLTDDDKKSRTSNATAVRIGISIGI